MFDTSLRATTAPPEAPAPTQAAVLAAIVAMIRAGLPAPTRIDFAGGRVTLRFGYNRSAAVDRWATWWNTRPVLGIEYVGRASHVCRDYTASASGHDGWTITLTCTVSSARLGAA
ncbi:hypothetical protein Val02_81740 [Virgisporangium aliadipatigenens]|uniref:Uncharacterized protein n=1 Tax=Virgisporangium aliadipatigenens TaxID=741659 RepID=A0A8J3YVI0_9ACTN|nr:hypothetical protein [Virgisporangium aliadipatigenens]GIJ51288.1 hypothetical protein Val02_81740 [Virgisporangium aliadipatigenens]